MNNPINQLTDRPISQTSERIYGDDIFFDFREIEYKDITDHLINDVKTRKIDGFVTKNVYSKEEVSQILSLMKNADPQYRLEGSTSTMYPAPFAIITDKDEKLREYFTKLNYFNSYLEKNNMGWFTERLNRFFNKCGSDFEVSNPINMVANQRVAPGNIRMFHTGKGGSPVHCGNFFRWRHGFFYSLLEPGIDSSQQLSYFVLLQNSEQGGELTIYDMVWDNVKRKVDVENNDSVINDAGERIYLTDCRQFTVKPQPGDILVFDGGRIWHRVEDIYGQTKRITFGGFINFSTDSKKFYYWC